MIKALRPTACLLSLALAIAACRLEHVPVPWTSLVTLFFITAATMLQNDWRDRYHDMQKGKVLALNKPRIFLTWVILFWIISCLQIAVIARENMWLAGLLMLMVGAGLLYSETRSIPMVPVALVSLAAASPTLIPWALGADISAVRLFFFAALFCVFAQEVIKDMADQEIDRGYKWTIPTMIGNRLAKAAIVIALLAGGFAALEVSSLALIGISFVALALMRFIVFGASPSTTEKRIDCGLALVLAALIVFPNYGTTTW